MGLDGRLPNVSDRALATLIGGALFVASAWPLAGMRLPPYQDLPDHLATLCVLLHPERYPEYLSNGWFKADSLLIWSCYVMAKHLGVLAAGRIFSTLVLACNALALPHFVLAFGGRRRLVVSSLVMAPMVQNWWVLMGMLNFALSLPVALVAIALLAAQTRRPTWTRGALLALCAGLLWFTHAFMLLLVGLLALVEVIRRWAAVGGRRGASTAVALLAPFAPAALLLLPTVLRHAAQTTRDPRFGWVSDVTFLDNLSKVYDLWAHWTFGMSPWSAAGLVPTIVLAVWAARRWRMSAAVLSPWAFFALFGVYWFFPDMMPGFGFVDERALPLMWSWALVRVPSRFPPWVGALLAAGCVAWTIGNAVDLFRGARDLDDFTAAAGEVSSGTRLLTLNFAPRVSSTNTWSLLHASGMYTILAGAKPQDLWADSPSAPLRRVRAPSFVEDPVSVREFLRAAGTPQAYCASLAASSLPSFDCGARWRAQWDEFWMRATERYDAILLWGAPPEISALVPEAYVRRFARGRLELRARAAASAP